MTSALARATAARSSNDLGLAAGTVAVVAWGVGPLIVASVGASTYTVVFWRLLAAAPVMVLVAKLTGGAVNRAMLRRALGPGVLFGGSLLAAFASFVNTSIANATLIGAMIPVLVLLSAPRLFGESVTSRQLAFSAVAVAGIVLVVVSGDSRSGAAMTGDLLALLDLVLFTIYFLWMKRERNDGAHSWSLIAGVFVVATAVVAPVCAVLSDDLGSLGGWDMAAIVAMVFGPGLLGHGLMTWAQRHIDVTVAALLTLACPVIAAIGAWIVLSQELAPLQLVGAIVVLVALGVITVGSRVVEVAESGVSGPPE